MRAALKKNYNGAVVGARLNDSVLGTLLEYIQWQRVHVSKPHRTKKCTLAARVLNKHLLQEIAADKARHLDRQTRSAIAA